MLTNGDAWQLPGVDPRCGDDVHARHLGASAVYRRPRRQCVRVEFQLRRDALLVADMRDALPATDTRY